MYIYDTARKEIAAEILGGENMTLDEALEFVGAEPCVEEEASLLIKETEYWYDNLIYVGEIPEE